MAEATRRITHVIFDLDGTLLDTEPLYFRAYQEVMARYGFEYTLETANALRGIPTSIGVPRLLAETQLPLDAERFIEQLEEILFRLYPTAQPTEGALRLTEHLACEGVPIAIATSSNARQLASKITAHEDWLGSFRAVVCADEVENGKPAPDLFIEAARRLGASPPRCLVFEDAPAGVAAARAASMAVVAIPEDGFGEAVADADLVIPSLAMFDPEPWGLPPFED